MNALTAGVVGLGLMGSAMSTHLLAANYVVLGYDIDADRRLEHTQRGGSVAVSSAEVSRHASIIITSMPSAAALEAAVLGRDGIADGANSPVTVIETSTLSLVDKERIKSEAATRNVTLLDCPLSGTGEQARARDLVAYLSGAAEPKSNVTDVLNVIARRTYDLGEFGNGSRVKLVANLLVTINNVAAAEALLLAQRAGLDLPTVLDAVGDGAGSSRMLQVRGPMMVAGDYSKASARIAMMQKDIDLIRALAADVHSPTPLLAAASVFYEAACGQEREDEDPACVFAVLQQLSGIGN